MEEMSAEIPDILRHRFRLLPLTREQARQAIIEPAQVEDKQISAGVFRYEPGAVEMMLDFLCKQKKREGFVTKDVIEDEVESFQLQLLCLHIERKVQRKTDKDAGEAVVKKEDLGGESGMQRVLQNFYHHQLRKLGPIRERRRVWNLFEKGLISATDRRLKLDEEYIESKFKVSAPRLSGLVNCRLLRSEKDERGVYYELSHDALVAPIRKSQYRRKIKVVSGVIFIIVISMLIGIMNLDKFKSEKQRLDEIDEFIEDTEAKYRTILKADNKNVDAYLGLGDLYSRTNRFEDAIDVYKEAIENGVEDARIYFSLGVLFFAQEEYDEAIKNFKKNLDINQRDAASHRYISLALSEQGKYDEAIEYYKKALEIDPENPEYIDTFNKLGNNLIKQGRKLKELKKYDEAIDILENAIKIISNDANAYILLGFSLLKKRKYDESIKKYKKVLKINPNIPLVHNTIGYILLLQEEYEEAIESFKKTLEIDPKYTKAYRNMASAFYYKKEFEDAILNFEKALELDPKFIPAKAYLAKAYLITGYLYNAYKLASEVLKEKTASILHILEMRFISTASLLLQEKKTEALSHVEEFVKYYRSMTGEPEHGWVYINIKNFINSNHKLKGNDKTLLLKLIDILESPKAKGIKKLKELEELLKTMK
jgi:pentatricopeptide repeat protein